MKSIKRKDFIPVGSVIKAHGTKGELKIRLDTDIQFKEWAFLQMAGKPVPFYILSVSGTADEPILQLEGISTPDEVQRFIGSEVLAIKRRVRKKDSEETLDLTGYSLVDQTLGFIGTVESMEEYPQQLLFQTTYRGGELLIPAVDEFILSIDENEKQVLLDLPEGLIGE